MQSCLHRFGFVCIMVPNPPQELCQWSELLRFSLQLPLPFSPFRYGAFWGGRMSRVLAELFSEKSYSPSTLMWPHDSGKWTAVSRCRFSLPPMSGVFSACLERQKQFYPRGRRKPFARDGRSACLSDGRKAPAKASWTSTVRKSRRCSPTGPPRSSSRSATILRLPTSQTG